MKLMPPILLQSYTDEFTLPKGENPQTPAVPGEVLQPCERENQVAIDDQKLYCKGVGKLLHMIHWSRPDILNAV
jgi:hypothetical protein